MEVLNEPIIQASELRGLKIVSVFPTVSLILAGGAFLLAWYLLGWPDLHEPISYGGNDTAFMLWLIQRVEQGVWYFNNPYSGFPFGSTFLDFPLSDSGNFIVLKFLGLFTHNCILIFNLYFLLGFSVTSGITYRVLDNLGLAKLYALVASLLFTFLPFHFLRIAHLFYTWYFSIPLYVALAFKVFSSISLFDLSKKWTKQCGSVFLLLFLSCFGVYYAFFAALLFIIAGIAGSLKWKTKKNILSALVSVTLLGGGVFFNILPNLIYHYKKGANPELVSRLPLETELYGLKLVQLLLPQLNHRFDPFREVSTEYYRTFPLVTENFIASLGLIGAMGFFLLLAVVLGAPFFRFSIDEPLQFFSFLNFHLFLFATIGGFSTFFSLLVTPLIRAWNRASVFIGFMSLAAFFLGAQRLLKKILKADFLKAVSIGLSLFLAVFGLWDQTSRANPNFLQQIKNQYLSDAHFVQNIEKCIPYGAIYQLPYMPFPEGAFLNNNNLMSYDLLRGYVHSEHLHWSFGGTKGRKGDLFFRQLAKQPLARQIEIVRQLGFNGIYIDRRGYPDHAVTIEAEIQNILKSQQILQSEDKNLSFFMLNGLKCG